MRRSLLACALCLLAGCGNSDHGGNTTAPNNVLVAVASNFVPALTRLKPLFEATGDYRLSMSVGSTGKLYAQIHAGAPYDVLLAADQERPRLLQREGLALDRFVYAEGQLVLWQTTAASQLAPLEMLRSGQFARLVMANPQLAPYGAAAQSTVKNLGLQQRVESKVVFGENLGQAHAMLATGNAELGFTALAFLSAEARESGRFWSVPANLYAPIRQEAALLQRGSENPAARAFVVFLQSSAARAIIVDAGYR